jgi:hypothetical protein
MSLILLILSLVLTSASYSSLYPLLHTTLPILILTPILLSPPSSLSCLPRLPHPPLHSLIPFLSSSTPSSSSPLPHTSLPLPHHTPRFSWRVLWFVGIPTGLIMLPLCNNIPESFRFLVVRHSRKRTSLLYILTFRAVHDDCLYYVNSFLFLRFALALGFIYLVFISSFLPFSPRALPVLFYP